ncbi:MAG: fumarate hydratase, partial [Actinomycetia bacterium]|nr:fumarate hydratase [Actinomycetes bacterium]
MREINVNEITKIVADLCISANTIINPSLRKGIKEAVDKEESEVGKSVLNQLLQNADIAEKDSVPICQDTGFAVIFLEIGEEVVFNGGSIKEA